MPTLLARPLRLLLVAGCLLAVFAVTPAPVRAAETLSDGDVKFMTLYEQVMKALVTDNLEAAKEAAGAIPGGDGADLAKAKDLKEARTAFAALSQKAEKIASGQPDYHVFNCPMVNRDWVEHGTTTIANPYMGKDMLTCGVEKK